MNIDDRDRRGRTEYGARIGAMIKSVYLTLNYIHVFHDDFLFKAQSVSLVPLAINFAAEYPDVDIYGATMNYYLGGVLNTVVTFEGIWVPDQPYQDAAELLPAIKDRGTFSYAVRFDRLTFVLPRPTSAMMIQFQFSQILREGDKNDILGTALSDVDTNDEQLTVQVRQPLWHNNIEISTLYVWDTDGAYLFKPGFKFVHGDHWYFDVFAVALGGSEKRPGRFGSLDWGDEVVFRVTYQF